MNRRNQHNFLDTAAPFRADDIGDDPLPLPAGWQDTPDPDAAGIPPERWTPDSLRNVRLGVLADDEDAAVRLEIASGTYYTPPEVLTQIEADIKSDLQRDLSDLDRQRRMRQLQADLDAGQNDDSDALRAEYERLKREHARPTDYLSRTEAVYAPPAGIPDAYKPTGTYCPSQGITDGLSAPREPVLAVSVSDGGRAQFADPEAIDAQSRAEFVGWFEQLYRVLVFAKWTLVVLAFCGVVGFAIASIFTGHGR